MPARHLDTRDDSYRSTYWIPPPMQTVPPQTAAKNEDLRQQLTKREAQCISKSSATSTRWHATELNSSKTLNPRPPMDPAAHDQQPQVQAWMNVVGATRSLATNVRDQPHAINVHTLRSERFGGFTEQMPVGGRTYSPGACVDNWVEERRDKCYRDGNRPPILRANSMWTSEYASRCKEVLGQYRENLKQTSGAPKFPEPGQDPRSAKRVGYDSDYLFYNKEGFGSTANCDHTAESKRGANWVGTAPPKPYSTMTMTTSKGERPEFQQLRNVSTDPRARIVRSAGEMDNLQTETIRANMQQTRHLTGQWQSTYFADFKPKLQRAA